MKRRDFVCAATAGVAVTTLDLRAWASDLPKQPAGVFGQGDWQFRQVEGWGIQDPKQVPIRNLHEIVQDKAGRIYVLGDHAQNNILVYQPDGTLERTLLTGLKGGHGLSLSQEDGQEYLWVTNTDGGDAFVRKVSLDGETKLEIRKPTTGPYSKDKSRYLPTEVEINPANGDIFVADGYGSSLLSHYDGSGKLLNIYGDGLQGKERYHCMHGVRLDLRNADEPLLWLTSRQDQEIRLVTLDGEQRDLIRFPGVGPCRASFVGENVIVPIIWVDPIGDQPRKPGFVLVLGADNQPVSMVGGRVRKLDSGETHFAQEIRDDMPFIFPHDAFVDRDGDLYVAQWNSKQTYPIKLARV